MMREKVHLFAVVRIENYLSYESAENTITIKEVLPTLDEAIQEVERLNNLNSEKGCRYFLQTTRYFPEGRGMRSDESAADSE